MNLIKKYFIKEIFLILLSILVVLYLLEFFLILIDFKDWKTRRAESILGTDNKFEILRELEVKNNKITVNYSPPPEETNKQLKLHPLSGVSNSITIDCNENGYVSTFVSDRFGFNNKNNKNWDLKNIDILLVGDSFANGACVNYKDTINGNLEKIKKNLKILNISKGGNGPLSEYASLREYLPFVNPKKIIWFYFEGNDLDNLSDELKNGILSKYLNEKNFSQNLYYKQNLIDNFLIKFLKSEVQNREIEKNKNSKLIKFVKLNRLVRFKNEKIDFIKLYYTKKIEKDNSLNKFSEIIFYANELAKNKGSEFYFVYLPDVSRYSYAENKKNLFYKEEIIQIVNKLNISIIDLDKELFAKQSEPLSLFPKIHPPSHYNEKGYYLVSKIVAKKLNIIIN
jgi:hypothetical protein